MSEKLTRERALKVIDNEFGYYSIDIRHLEHDCEIVGENEKGETLVKYQQDWWSSYDDNDSLLKGKLNRLHLVVPFRQEENAWTFDHDFDEIPIETITFDKLKDPSGAIKVLASHFAELYWQDIDEFERAVENRPCLHQELLKEIRKQILKSYDRPSAED